MAYALSYCGVTFRIPSKDLMDRLDRFEWLSTLADVLPQGQDFPGAKFTSLGFPMPRAYPPLRIGDFFYPVGASRFSVFRGIMTAEDLDTATGTVYPNDNNELEAGLFIIQSEGGDAIGQFQNKMLMLPPIPLAGIGQDDPQIFLVTLVDERYLFHQWDGAGVITCTALTTTGSWSDLLASIAGTMGITLTFNPVEPVYGVPEPDSAIYTNWESPAVLLDAVAANIGRVVVRSDYLTYRLLTWEEAIEDQEANRPLSKNNLVGGAALTSTNAPISQVNRSMMPQNVTVTFPKWVDNVGYYEPEDYRSHVLDSYGAVLAVNVNLADLDAPYEDLPYFAGTKYMSDTAKATYSTEAAVIAEDDPTNLSDLESLAQKMAMDYYDQRRCWLDEAYAGVFLWPPEGVSDILVSWRAGEVFTRVSSPPFNQGQTQFQHGFGPLSEGPSGTDCAGVKACNDAGQVCFPLAVVSNVCLTKDGDNVTDVEVEYSFYEICLPAGSTVTLADVVCEPATSGDDSECCDGGGTLVPLPTTGCCPANQLPITLMFNVLSIQYWDNCNTNTDDTTVPFSTPLTWNGGTMQWEGTFSKTSDKHRYDNPMNPVIDETLTIDIALACMFNTDIGEYFFRTVLSASWAGVDAVGCDAFSITDHALWTVGGVNQSFGDVRSVGWYDQFGATCSPFEITPTIAALLGQSTPYPGFFECNGDTGFTASSACTIAFQFGVTEV